LVAEHPEREERLIIKIEENKTLIIFM